MLDVADLSLAVPTVNSLSLVFTMLTGKLLGEEFGGKSGSDRFICVHYYLSQYHDVCLFFPFWMMNHSMAKVNKSMNQFDKISKVF